VSDRRAAELALDQPAEVREEERIDPAAIEPFLRRALPDAAGPVSVLQFPKGHSNLTYLLVVGEREVVLRRPPFGVKVKSAHDMKREYDILSALKGVYGRAPMPIAFCDDESLIGAKFYLMERVRGVILRGDKPAPGITFTPELMRKSSTGLVDNLADLHAIDVTRAPLSSMGRPQGYVARQVTGWTERYYKAKTDEVPGVEAAAAWLARNMPRESGAAVIHNDYKYDNVMLDPNDLTRIVATRAYGPTYLPGSLSRMQLVERYSERSGRAVGSILFYYVFALFKIAVIVQQIYKRYVEGHTRDPRFASLIHWVRVMAHQAERALTMGRIDRLGEQR
jgi:aminoglycoside phosphotransferase (APT) family kinase protein